MDSSLSVVVTFRTLVVRAAVSIPLYHLNTSPSLHSYANAIALLSKSHRRPQPRVENMKQAYVFPGQGSALRNIQQEEYYENEDIRQMLDTAATIFGMDFRSIDMTDKSDPRLNSTSFIQPLVFLSSMADYFQLNEPKPDMVAGHSVGEFSALVAAGAISVSVALQLLQVRALAMQKACDAIESSMAAVDGLSVDIIQHTLIQINRKGLGYVVVANMNCHDQTVISGHTHAIKLACKSFQDAGARRVTHLRVNGGFHSPLMMTAQEQLIKAIELVEIREPVCPIFQNTTACPTCDPQEIRANMMNHITSPVRWEESVRSMIASGATNFVEFGPGKVLQKFIRKIDSGVLVGNAIQPSSWKHVGSGKEIPLYSDIEQRMQYIWAEILNIETDIIGLQDSFMDLGGDSVLAMQLVSLAQQQGLSFSVADVLMFPQFSDLVKVTTKHQINAEKAMITPFSLLNPDILHEYARTEAARLSKVDPAMVETTLPCTALQQGMLALSARDPSAYVSRMIFPILSSVEILRLKAAWETVLTKMSILRARIVDLPRQGVVQVVINELPEWLSGDSISTYIAEDEKKHMELGTCLSRQAIVEEHEKSFLIWTIHHAVYDGWSMRMFLNEVNRVYQGEEPQSFTQFDSFIKYLMSIDPGSTKDYWARQLDGLEAPQFPALPSSTYQPKANQLIIHRIEHVSWILEKATAASVIKGAWSLVVSQHTDSNDVLFGATVSGRQAALASIDRVAGPTIATVPIRVNIDLDSTIHEFLQQLQSQAIAMIPYEQAGLQEIARINSDASRGCQFQTLTVVQSKQLGAVAGCNLFNHDYLSKAEASRALKAFNNYGLMIEFIIDGKSVELRLNFDNAILSSSKVKRMAEQFEHFLAQLCCPDNLGKKVSDLDSTSQQDLIDIWSWNRIVPETVRGCVHDLISDRAAIQPDAEAICAWDGSFTFKQLDHFSTLLGKFIRHSGVGRGAIVPLCFEKSKWTAIAMLAVMKAGGASVTMDSTQPEERLKQIVQQAQPRLIISSASNRNMAAGLSKGTNVVILNSQLLDRLEQEHNSLPNLPQVLPIDILYIVFTSGSTGVPKGCVITHENFTSCIRHQREPLRFNESTRLFGFVSYAFDVTWLDFIQTISAGGCLCVPSEEDRKNNIAASMRNLRANYINIPPSAARVIDPKAVPDLRTISVGGEPMTEADLTRWGNNVEVIQAYGPAECTPPVALSYFEDKQHIDTANIGRGYGVNYWLVNPSDHSQLVGVGCVGEILLEGPIVGLGYLGDPEKTAASFVNDPLWLAKGAPDFSGRDGRLYKTGDLGRYASNGTVVFIGRKDAQVKIRGQRVELSEVEHHVQTNINSHFDMPIIAETIVPKNSSNALLVIFLELCLTDDANSPEASARLEKAVESLEERLLDKLPVYMVPTHYIPIQKLPMTATGKTNRRQLREFGSSFMLEELTRLSLNQSKGERTPPTTPTELLLQELWMLILGIDGNKISANDSFLRIGGDSIGAMRLVSMARERGYVCTVADIFEHTRLSDLAKVLRKEVLSEQKDILPFSLLGPNIEKNWAIDQVAVQCAVPVDDIEDIFPCTPLQEGLLSQTLRRPGAYIARKVYKLPENIDLERLKSAITLASKEIAIWRTRIIDLPGQGVVQAILKSAPEIADNNDLDTYLHIDMNRDLMTLGSPLTRFGIVSDGQKNQCFLVWTIHHALYDGWSRPLMLQSIQKAYFKEISHKLVGLQPFVNYIRSPQDSEVVSYWVSQMQDLASPQFPMLPSSSYEPIGNQRKLHTIASIQWPQENVTASTVVRLAWAILQSKYTNSTDVLFGETTTGRQAAVPHIEHIAGPTFATIPVRFVLDNDKTILESMYKFQKQTLQRNLYEQTGLQNIRKYTPDTDQACAFQTLLLVQPPAQRTTTNIADFFRPIQAQKDDSFKIFNTYAILVEFHLQEAGVIVDISYDSNVMSDTQVERILEQYEAVIRQICSTDIHHTTLKDISAASCQDLNEIWRWNQAEPQTLTACFHEIFSEKAQLQPDAAAVSAWDGDLTYAQLDQMSSALARYLVQLGLRPGSIVPLLFEKSMWMPVAQIGTMKAGGGCIALDPAQPQERLRAIMHQVTPKVILASVTNYDVAIQLDKNLDVVIVDLEHMNKILSNSNQAISSPLPKIDPSSCCFIQFTSGSTGTPKGSIMTHQNCCSLVLHQSEYLGFTSTSRVYDFSSYAFDSSWSNFFNTLSTGGCLCVPSQSERDNNLFESLKSFRADILDITPSAGRSMLPECPPSVKIVLFGGEPLTNSDLRWLGHAKARNAYGPSETTITATLGPELYATTTEPITLGKGRGLNTWVVDPDHGLSLTPLGAVGELYLEGPLVGNGYISEPEKTRAAFIEDPPWLVKGAPGYSGRKGRLYKTGDLVQYLPDGSIVYIGRKDSQVKIRGQRVELEEVEHHVRFSRPSSRESTPISAEVIKPREAESGRLAVFFGIGKDATGSPTEVAARMRKETEGLQETLSRRVPVYMIPAYYIPLEHIPRLINGKTDRRRLRELGSSFTLDQLANLNPARGNGNPPQTAFENKLQELWASILHLDGHGISREDHFFQIGGDSIAAMRLVGLAHKNGLQLNVAQVFNNPQLCSLAAVMEEKKPQSEEISFVVEPFSLMPGSPVGTEDLIHHAARLCGVSNDSIEDIYPCTSLQEGLLATTAKNGDQYIARMVYDLSPSVEISKFQSAWDQVIAATAILRTRIVDLGTYGLAQIVLRPYSSSKLITSKTDATKEPRSMGLGTPLMQYDIMQHPDGRRCFSLTMHHALYDGWSMPLLLAHIESTYNGQEIKAPTPFRNFIKHVVTSWNDSAIEFWKNHLDGSTAESFPSLPTPAYQPRAKDQIHHDVSQLKWPRDSGITPSTLLRTAWAILSSRYTNSNEAIFGLTVTGRNIAAPGIEEVLGCTISTLPFRVCLNYEEPLEALLAKVQALGVEMIPFEQTGLTRIRRISLGIEHASKFQTLVLIGSEIDKGSTPSAGGVFANWEGEAESASDIVGAFSTYAVTLQCGIHSEGARVRLSFDPVVLDKNQAQRIALQFGHILRQICESENQSRKLSHIDWICAQDLHDISSWNSTRHEPVKRPVHELIFEHARTNPEALAICAWDGELSYKDLDRLSTQLASYLVQRKLVSSGQAVPLCFNKSKWTVVATLAVMKSGAASIFVKPTASEEHLKSRCEQVKAQVILVSSLELKLRYNAIQGGPIIVVDEEFFQCVDVAENTGLPTVDPDDLLHIHFGSLADASKAIEFRHTYCASAIAYQQDSVSFGPSTRMFDLSSFTSSVFWSNILHVLGSGACLCIPSEADQKNNITGAFSKLNANTICLTPTLSQSISPDTLSHLNTLILYGERVSKEEIERWGQIKTVQVAYGSLETGIMSTITAPAVLPEHNAESNIGFAAGCCGWVLDPITESPTLLGAVGELYIEGPIVCSSYLDGAEKTEEFFKENLPWLMNGPFGNHSRSRRLYKTGDFVKQNLDGSFTFMYRADEMQIKIQGQPVDTSQVESSIRQLLSPHAGNKQVVIEKVRPKGSSEMILVAFVSDDQVIKKLSKNEVLIAMRKLLEGIDEKLAELLPGYALPGAYIPLPSIPITDQGKTARNLLRGIGESMSLGQLSEFKLSQRTRRQPETTAEKQLVQLCSEILSINVDQMSADDSFFRIGGDSITAMRLVAALRATGWNLQVADVVRNPQLSTLARIMDENAALQTQTQSSFGSTISQRHDFEIAAEKVLSPQALRKWSLSSALPVSHLQTLFLDAAAMQPPQWWNYFYIDFPNLTSDETLKEICTFLWNQFDALRAIFVRYQDRYLQLFVEGGGARYYCSRNK